MQLYISEGSDTPKQGMNECNVLTFEHSLIFNFECSNV